MKPKFPNLKHPLFLRPPSQIIINVLKNTPLPQPLTLFCSIVPGCEALMYKSIYVEVFQLTMLWLLLTVALTDTAAPSPPPSPHTSIPSQYHPIEANTIQ